MATTLNLGQAASSGGLSFSGNKPSGYQGPVLPGQTIGGRSPIGQTAPSILSASTGPSNRGVSTGVSSPVATPTSNAPMIPTPQQPNIDFDALIAPALQGLDAAIQPLTDSTNADIQGIQSNQQTQTDQTNASIGQQTNTINQAKATQKQYETNAADEARRQYAEINQGIQSRYGGTTGTGAFASELAGSQTLRSIANVRQAASQAQAGLDDKLQQVQEVGRIALQDITNQANDQISKAKSNLELQLADIRNQKGQLMAHKAELAANAVQSYQQTVNQVNASNTQFKQQLYLQQQQAQQQLQTAMTHASGIASAATPQELISLIQKYQQAGISPTITQGLPGGGGSLSLTPAKSQGNTNDTTDILSQLGLQ